MREKVQFETNVPVTVAFAFDQPIKVEGRYGDQYLFTTEDDRVAYLPPVVADRIHALGVVRGEDVVICKKEVKAGARRTIQWFVDRADASRAVQQNGVAAPSVATPQPTSPLAKAEANGHPATAPIRTALEACLIEAVSAAVGAERWAKDHDCSVRFTSEDIRALGISLYIQRERTQQGGRS